MPGTIRRGANAIAFAVRLTPKSAHNMIEGWAVAADGKIHLKARVRAVPEDGKANTALIALVAGALNVPKSAVRIASGRTARLKIVEVAGAADVLAARIEALGMTK
jgi:uncharacterized protein YggU (UPF0235/DUF167 family)